MNQMVIENDDKRSALTRSCLQHQKGTMTASHVSHKHKGQVAEMTNRCTPSQTDVILVVMDALVRIYEEDLIAPRNVTAIPVTFCTSSLVSQSADCQLVCKDDDDDTVQVIGCCHDPR